MSNTYSSFLYLMRSIILIVGLITSLAVVGFGQRIAGFSSYYDDAFHEWTILTSDPDLEGQVDNVWFRQDRWSTWNVRIGDLSGEVSAKWRNDVNIWDVRLGDSRATVRTLFRNRFDRWEIRDGEEVVTLEYVRSEDIWLLKTAQGDESILYTERYGDPRDWIIDLSFRQVYSPALEFGAYFIPVLFTTHARLR